MTTRSLSARRVAGAKPKGERRTIPDGEVPGLYLRVTSAGVKSWAMAYRFHGQQRLDTLGRADGAEALSLKDARDRALERRALLRDGKDPRAMEAVAQAEADAPAPRTFQTLAEEFVAARAPRLADRTKAEYSRMVEVYIGASPVARVLARDVRKGDLRALLETVAEERGPVMANRVFQLVRAVCRWGVREDFLELNPCAGVERPRREAPRERVLQDHEVAALWAVLNGETVKPGEAEDAGEPETFKAPLVVAAAVKLLLLLGQRTGETVAMRWADLDLHAKLWTIPGAFRKGDRLHVVPVSPAAVSVLNALRPVTGGNVRVLHGVTGVNAERDWWGEIRDATLAELKRRGGSEAERFSKHDLRRTCATGCARLGASPFVVSRILGHATPTGGVKVTGVYDRFDRMPEMAAALKVWGAHVERVAKGKARKGAEVVAFGRSGRR